MKSIIYADGNSKDEVSSTASLRFVHILHSAIIAQNLERIGTNSIYPLVPMGSS